MRWRGLEDEARSLLAGAQSSALFVAPFIKEAALRPLLEVLRPDVEVRVYTRWRPDEVAMGVSDTSVLDLVEQRGGTVWLLDELHAKVIAADGTDCLVGSANITASGLGTSRRPNLEVMRTLRDARADLALFVAELRARSRRATGEERLAIEAKAALIRSSIPAILAPDAEPAQVASSDTWLPRFRSPDRLYHLYSDPDWLVAAKASDPALLDLLDIGLPAGLARGKFEDAVRARLLASPGVALVDGILDEPQRFGAVTAALKTVTPDSSHAERQVTAQTLIRWLLHFAPDRYRMDTPNYSEVLAWR